MPAETGIQYSLRIAAITGHPLSRLMTAERVEIWRNAVPAVCRAATTSLFASHSYIGKPEGPHV